MYVFLVILSCQGLRILGGVHLCLKGYLNVCKWIGGVFFGLLYGGKVNSSGENQIYCWMSRIKKIKVIALFKIIEGQWR